MSEAKIIVAALVITSVISTALADAWLSPDAREPSFSGSFNDAGMPMGKRSKFPWLSIKMRPPLGKGGKGPPGLTPIHAVPCRGGCNCTRAGHRLFADCSAVLANHATLHAEMGVYPTGHIIRFPDHLQRFSVPRNVTNLDFSHNNVSVIEKDDFRRFEHMDELILDGNRVVYIHPEAFAGGIPPLRILSLRKNNLSDVPWEALKHLSKLEILHLDENSIEEIPTTAFVGGLGGIRQLFLARNHLATVPHAALNYLSELEAISLASNKITRIRARDFANLTKLEVLNLGYNAITEIEDEAFAGLHSLKIVELNGNLLDKVPPSLSQLDHLEELTLANNRITYVPELAFRRNTRLSLLELKGNPIITMDRGAFSHLPHLKKLIISDIRDLREFPDLNGTWSLELLTVDRASIQHVPPELCDFAPQLKALDLKSCELEELPDLRNCTKLKFLDLEHNHIAHLDGMPFRTLTHLSDLLLGGNRIKTLMPESFIGLGQLQVLDLGDNLIDDIHPDAFLPLTDLQDLNLGNNRFPRLPENGLQSVRHLKVHNIPQLRDFPPPESFPKVHTLALSYAYHCCQFLPESPSFGGVDISTESTFLDQLKESWYIPEKGDKFDESLWTNMNMSDFWPGFYENITEKFGDFAGELFDNFGEGYPNNFPSYIEYLDQQVGNPDTFINAHARTPIKCIPKPGPFMPCQDLFDWWALRCGVWIVFLLALLGNGAVVSVLILARSKMDVPRFLVCNLAAADFFMGIYLGFLAVVDAMTLGEFRRYAIPWQMSPACQVAGFMGVLSSELSVYTLAVITLERNYAITHAMHLNKRLSLRHASYIMVCGWTFALIMAVLPLTGISDYRKFAVCLPFETGDGASLGYVIFLMFINGVAFIILMGCYLKMYCAIRGSQAWNSNDSRIAKRMALLVFTDFSCWFPIAFFSLTAAFGVNLISLEGAKVFTVFILPLNSCCNPFLYAIMTKQFKKDCVLICKAIEESRVTRGIGRCRHSSNFSNRHTPANTNSTGDRNSNQSAVKEITCTCKRKPHTSACLENLRRSRKTRNRNRWWNRFQSLFSQKNQPEPLESVDSSNYTYQIAELQQKPNPKTVRNHSVSSDNFSSSRSDSVRHANCTTIPLRMMNRRRNSWTYTRRGSQDSNLSNSRNDSSAASNSTATWRISRSSVSSDTSHGTGPRGPYGSFKDRRASEHLHHLPASRMNTMRFKAGLEGKPSFPPQLLKQQSSGLLKNIPGGVGPRPILKQNLVATGSSASGMTSGADSPASTSSGVLNWPSLTRHDSLNSGRNGKPRLKRQVAIQELEDQQLPGGKVVSFDPQAGTAAVMYCCPVHPDRIHTRHFEDLIESSHEADEEDEEEEEEEESESEDSGDGGEPDAEEGKGSPEAQAESGQSTSSGHHHHRNPLIGGAGQGSFLGGTGGFIPRKLSTISSMSQRSTSSATQKEVANASSPALEEITGSASTAAGSPTAAAAGTPDPEVSSPGSVSRVVGLLGADEARNTEDGASQRSFCSCDCIISPETTAWLASLPKVKLKTKCSSENELTRGIGRKPSPMKTTSSVSGNAGPMKVASSCTNFRNYGSDSFQPSSASRTDTSSPWTVVDCPKAVFDVFEDDEEDDDDVFAPVTPKTPTTPKTTTQGKFAEAGTPEEKASLLQSADGGATEGGSAAGAMTSAAGDPKRLLESD